MRDVAIWYAKIKMRLTLSNGDHICGALIWLVLAFHSCISSSETHQNATNVPTSALNSSAAIPRSQNTSFSTVKSLLNASGMTSVHDRTSYAGSTSHASYISNSTGIENVTTARPITTQNVMTTASTPTYTHGAVHVSIRKTSGNASPNAPRPLGCVYAIPIVVTMILLLM